MKPFNQEHWKMKRMKLTDLSFSDNYMAMIVYRSQIIIKHIKIRTEKRKYGNK